MLTYRNNSIIFLDARERRVRTSTLLAAPRTGCGAPTPTTQALPIGSNDELGGLTIASHHDANRPHACNITHKNDSNVAADFGHEWSTFRRARRSCRARGYLPVEFSSPTMG